MGIIGNRALQGQPILPYPNVKAYAGGDVFIDMVFLDHTQTPVVPTSLTFQLDDLTNDENMIASTTITTGFPAAGGTYTLQLPASEMQMTFPYEGSQLCQLSGTFLAIDSVTGNQFTGPVIAIIELCAIQTPSGISQA